MDQWRGINLNKCACNTPEHQLMTNNEQKHENLDRNVTLCQNDQVCRRLYPSSLDRLCKKCFIAVTRTH